MPGFGYSSEFLLIFIVALLVFGPKRLPELAKSLGRAMHEFKRSMNEFKNQIETEVGADKIKEDLLGQMDFKPSGQPARNTIETEEDYAKPADQEPVSQPGQAQRNKASFPGGAADDKAGTASSEEAGQPAPPKADKPAEAPAKPEAGQPAPKKTDA